MIVDIADVVGFTGTRFGMTQEQHEAMEFYIDEAWHFHHGMCIGADKEAHDIAMELGVKIEGHPPEVKTFMAQFPEDNFLFIHRPKPYLVRNREIVDSVDLMYATPKEDKEVLRSGTWSTVRYAVVQEVPVKIIYPDGRVEVRE